MAVCSYGTSIIGSYSKIAKQLQLPYSCLIAARLSVLAFCTITVCNLHRACTADSAHSSECSLQNPPASSYTGESACTRAQVLVVGQACCIQTKINRLSADWRSYLLSTFLPTENSLNNFVCEADFKFVQFAGGATCNTRIFPQNADHSAIQTLNSEFSSLSGSIRVSRLKLRKKQNFKMGCCKTVLAVIVVIAAAAVFLVSRRTFEVPQEFYQDHYWGKQAWKGENVPLSFVVNARFMIFHDFSCFYNNHNWGFVRFFTILI